MTPTRELAWLVGCLERDESVFYFALNGEGEEVWERWGQPSARRQLVVSIFRELGVVSVRDRVRPDNRSTDKGHPDY